MLSDIFNVLRLQKLLEPARSLSPPTVILANLKGIHSGMCGWKNIIGYQAFMYHFVKKITVGYKYCVVYY